MWAKFKSRGEKRGRPHNVMIFPWHCNDIATFPLQWCVVRMWVALRGGEKGDAKSGDARPPPQHRQPPQQRHSTKHWHCLYTIRWESTELLCDTIFLLYFLYYLRVATFAPDQTDLSVHIRLQYSDSPLRVSLTIIEAMMLGLWRYILRVLILGQKRWLTWQAISPLELLVLVVVLIVVVVEKGRV